MTSLSLSHTHTQFFPYFCRVNSLNLIPRLLSLRRWHCVGLGTPPPTARIQHLSAGLSYLAAMPVASFDPLVCWVLLVWLQITVNWIWIFIFFYQNILYYCIHIANEMFIKWMFQYRLVKSQHTKGTEGIKDISNTCSRFVVVKHIIYKNNINFSYFL
jgi:hypothetical protein